MGAVRKLRCYESIHENTSFLFLFCFLFFSCNCTHLLERGAFYLLFLKSVFTWKPILTLSSRFTVSNLSFSSFKISVSEICIPTSAFELVKRWHFSAFATKRFVENQWNIFLMLAVDCLAHFLYLKTTCKEYCHLHIQQSQLIYGYYMMLWSRAQVRKLRRKKKYNVIAKKLCFLSTWC